MSALRPVTAPQIASERFRGVGAPQEGQCSFCGRQGRHHAVITRAGAEIIAHCYRGPVPVFHDLCGLHFAIFGVATVGVSR